MTAKMTKKERIIAAIRGEDVDGIPSGFFMHFPPECVSGDEAVKAHLDFFRDTDADIAKIMNENLIPAMPEIRTAGDYGNMRGVDGHADFIREQLMLAKEIRKACKEEVFLVGTIHGIVASGIHPMEPFMGYEGARQKLCEFLRSAPKKAEQGLRKIADAMCILAEGYIKAGADGVYYASLGGETDYFTDEEFDRWVRPYDIQIMQAVRAAGGYCILHICQKNLNMLRYRGYEKYCDVVNWGVNDAPLSLKDGKELFQGKTIMGGMKNRSGVFVNGSHEEVRDEVRKVVEEAGRKGFILGAD